MTPDKRLGWASYLAAVAVLVGAYFVGEAMPSATDLRGTAETWKCKEYCELPEGGCYATQDCIYSPINCSKVIKIYSGICDTGGPLESCTTQPSGDFCYKLYQQQCAPENIQCTNYISGCGSGYRCV